MTCALITVYHPSEIVKENVMKVAEQVDTVYICDNSLEPQQERFCGIANVRYVCFGENLGLSCAFNRILKDPEISWKDEDFVVFFDQDSSISEHHVAKLIQAYQNVQKAGYEIGCLGPQYFNTSSGRVEVPKMKTQITEDTFSVSSIITSSMLCTYGSLREIDFWNEDVFLDMADWDICWRMCAAGKMCCLTESVTLCHSVGLKDKKIGPFRMKVGNPYREYYQIRECLYLLGKKYTPMKYKIRFLIMLFIRSPLHILFLENRKDRIQYITMGVGDFFRKKHCALESR